MLIQIEIYLQFSSSWADHAYNNGPKHQKTFLILFMHSHAHAHLHSLLTQSMYTHTQTRTPTHTHKQIRGIVMVYCCCKGMSL